MERHLLMGDNCIQWYDNFVDNVWTFGFHDAPLSVETLREVQFEEPLKMIPESHVKTFTELYPDGYDFQIPWRWILGEKKYTDLLQNVAENAKLSICALEASGYHKTYKKIRKFLTELRRPIVDVDKLAKYIHQNDKGMTVETSLRSFAPIESLAPSIKYDLVGTATGRLTVKKGPKILTLPARYRDIIKAEDGCDIVQIDLVSAEPRTALYVSGNTAEGDVYNQISKDLGFDFPRDVIKVASLSALYGAGLNSLTNLLGSKFKAKRVVDNLKSHFKVNQVTTKLAQEMKDRDYITNLFGRRLATRTDEIQKVYSHFMQSTTSDAALSMFSDFCKSALDVDSNFKSFYVIHDALVCQVSKSKRQELQSMSRILHLDDVGDYETKMTSVNDN